MPFGYAAHPYLTVGEATVDEVDLRVPAASYLRVDDRLLPVSTCCRSTAPKTICGPARRSAHATSTWP